MVKKCYTKIGLCISDKSGRAIYVGQLQSGHDVDFNLFKAELSQFRYGNQTVWVDLGFVGIKKKISDVTICIPHKKPRGKELTDEQKKEDTAMARIRVEVEHAIGGIKRCFILQHRSRLKDVRKLSEALHHCTGLWNFRRDFTVNIALNR